jgi:tRNA pseudouridine55 synthase
VYRAEIECSSGTYVRVLAHDLGRALGGGAHVADLRRTRIGSFGEGVMRPLERLGPDDVLTPAQAVRDLDAVTVEPAIAASVRTGLPLDKVPLGAVGDGPWSLLDDQGVLLAVYEATGSDRIRPAVVLAGD